MEQETCGLCGLNIDLYISNCKHIILCLPCGKKMAEDQSKCSHCGVIITRLLREYNVLAPTTNDQKYFIGRFISGLPDICQSKWSLEKDELQTWHLEDETGQSQYQGHPLQGAQSDRHYLLLKEGKHFVAVPLESWYNFKKVSKYKQLTLEEAEVRTKHRKKIAYEHERWMMKAAKNEAAAFGQRGVKSTKKSEDDEDHIEKGDGWDHEETFSDDEEAVGVDPEDREGLAIEVSATHKINQDVDDGEEGNGNGGGLSKYGKEMKKLLRRDETRWWHEWV